MDARPVRLTAEWGLLVVGVAITALAVLGPMTLAGLQLSAAAPPVKALLVASAAVLVLTIAFAPERTNRFELLVSGLAALGGLSLIAMAGNPLIIAMLLLLLGAFYAARQSEQPFVARLRNPVMAALLLGLGGVLVALDHNDVLERVGALGLVLGLVAAAGLAPFLYRVERGERVSSSGVAWTAFFVPVLALVLVAQVLPTMHPAEASVFVSVCLALGLLNVGWGVLAAWRSTDDAATWRHGLIADWGLVLCGMGMLTPQVLGGKAAYLLLLSILLVRLPLYVFAQPGIRTPREERGGAGLLGLLVGLALAGAAPFAGFAARLVLLQAAMNVAWPLAVLLLLAMLAYLGHCVRLGASIGRPSARAGAGMVVVLALSTVLGVIPGVLLSAGGY